MLKKIFLIFGLFFGQTFAMDANEFNALRLRNRIFPPNQIRRECKELAISLGLGAVALWLLLHKHFEEVIKEDIYPTF
ncbi:hypothetical protein M1446_03170 [Candidatus Dependentiae bacterium]|nr:hypothetical protein [Candidatus Dependentiae bacterium]